MRRWAWLVVSMLAAWLATFLGVGRAPPGVIKPKLKHQQLTGLRLLNK